MYDTLLSGNKIFQKNLENMTLLIISKIWKDTSQIVNSIMGVGE